MDERDSGHTGYDTSLTAERRPRALCTNARDTRGEERAGWLVVHRADRAFVAEFGMKEGQRGEWKRGEGKASKYSRSNISNEDTREKGNPLCRKLAFILPHTHLQEDERRRRNSSSWAKRTARRRDAGIRPMASYQCASEQNSEQALHQAESTRRDEAWMTSLASSEPGRQVEQWREGERRRFRVGGWEQALNVVTPDISGPHQEKPLLRIFDILLTFVKNFGMAQIVVKY
ncbi:hypothetical protein C8R45DRAFT_939661 [Mycena sanguinolenta]|nr:hypothetical protein C8R45DRAFT_939661 [Mycena sanguinolenta]